ncbi:DUF1858 domain-containing protein [Albimonas sp. CAU 1670]|uniref:DUF1858 domain-containing protein n=1 Tax=Albimonas sp. CAU 1670 TaxID=3032599 RepID=UPI0023DAFE67|nr:DUF1858 domain-containing protein [Albimonas sp. CAU 1670]MDF2233199.1 DUF1858 domain-containing protein [Albimonas sp. CAU 1670]
MTLCRSPETRGGEAEETLAELFARQPEAAAAFWARGMRCPGCPIAPFHSLTDACAEYGVDPAGLRADIRATTAARGEVTEGEGNEDPEVSPPRR